MAITFQTTQYNLIYVYSRKEITDALKIGKASVVAYNVEELTPNCEMLNKAAIERINAETLTAAVQYELLYTEVAYYVNKDTGMRYSFSDTDVHNVLKASGYEKKDFGYTNGNPNEWYKVNLETAIKAISAVKNEQNEIDGPPVKKKTVEIKFREEQEDAVSRTIAHFRNGRKMLWNAKMRFGKTLCALELIRRQAYAKVLILTHRPAVRDGWFEDYHNLKFVNYQYGSKIGSATNACNESDKRGKDFDTLEKNFKEKQRSYIYFASMQDLRGSSVVSDKGINKNDQIFKTKWDLIILDEAHEGTETKLGKNVLNELCRNKKPYLLFLSGTPFNILHHFTDEEIYTWDYVMEQMAKERWSKEHPNEPNPYEGLAKLNIYTYNIGDVFERNNYTRTDEDYFNFSEFFRVWTGDESKDGMKLPSEDKKGTFIHEDDVIRFLDLLCNQQLDTKYPFSEDEFCKALSHTLWMLPGVASAAALEKLIHKHRLHTELNFETINVAGEGSQIESLDEDDGKKIERQSKEALNKVRKGIQLYSRTITLSCGRLTTGVSVPEWTGVFMLRGGDTVDAGNYMQTIFRGQTPYKNGAIKTNCYAFDFAPDRTLTVINDYIKEQTSRRKRKKTVSQSNNNIERIENFLRLCPVISMEGSREVEYSAMEFIKEVNRAYSDYVIRCGFKGRALIRNYADFSDEDYQMLEAIGKVLEGNKGNNVSDGNIVMADSDLVVDKGKLSIVEGKSKVSLTSKNKSKKKQDESEKRKRAQEVFDHIMIRLPLLIFGAVERTDNLKIKDLLKDDVIDQTSWEEFMPRGFTKKMFEQMAPLIREDVMMASIDGIINEAKEADELSVEDRVMKIAEMLSRFHYPDKETVLTPWRAVNMHMSDCIGGYCFYDENFNRLIDRPRWIEHNDVTNHIFNPNGKVLEINSKSGVYPLYLAYSFWRVCCQNSMFSIGSEEEYAIWERVLSENVFVLCQTRMAEKITRRVLAGYKKIPVRCRTYEDNGKTMIEILSQKDNKVSRAEKENIVKQINTTKYWGIKGIQRFMKFNAIVSNPPYNIKDGGNKASAKPIYQHFVKLAKNISPNYISIITPAKWFNGGKGLDEYRSEMLSDNHITHLHDYIDGHDCFSNVDIAGGVCYFLWDGLRKDNTNCNVITHFNGRKIENIRPLNAVDVFIRHIDELSILEKISGESEFLQVYPRKPFGLATNVQPLEEGDIFLRYGGGRGFYKSELVPTLKEQIGKWKVITSRLTAEHAGETDKNGQKRIISTLEILEPGVVCAETYLLMATFDTKKEAENMLSYIKTRFVRCLIGMITSTQQLSRINFRFVPLQDFSKSWTDEELYAQYGLTGEEIAFIESMIKPMD